MGIFGQDVNINVNRDVNNGNDNGANTPVITRAAVRQQRKLEQEIHERELDRQYRELAYAEYDVNDTQQIVHTMTQLATYVDFSRQSTTPLYARIYQAPALSNLKTGIDLLRSVDSSNPMIAHFEQKIDCWEKQNRQNMSLVKAVVFGCLIFLIIFLACIIMFA